MSMRKQTLIGIALVAMALLAPTRAVRAQEDRLKKIENQLSALEQRISSTSGTFEFIQTYLPAALAILGIGLFCGLWARNSGRDFWLWFVAGLVFTIFALIAVANAHEEDKKAKKKVAKEALDL